MLWLQRDQARWRSGIRVNFKWWCTRPAHKLPTHAARTHIFGHEIKVAQCAVQPLHPPQRLCLICWAAGWKCPKTFDRSGKHCVYRPRILKGLLEIWHSVFLSLEDKWQTPRGCCSDCRTNWPSSGCIYSASRRQSAAGADFLRPQPPRSGTPERPCWAEPRRGLWEADQSIQMFCSNKLFIGQIKPN